MTEPETKPPPITLSISLKLVFNRGYSKVSFFKYSNFILCPDDLDNGPEGFETFSSSREFHSLQCSHLPLHFECKVPQIWQIYCLFNFDI